MYICTVEYVYIHICTDASLNIYISIYVHICVYTHTVYICIHMCVHTYIYICIYIYVYMFVHIHIHTCIHIYTGWRRLIGSPKLQIIFHKRATKYRSLLRKMTFEDKGTYESSPPCMMCSRILRYATKEPLNIGHFCGK